MLLRKQGQALEPVELPVPEPGPGQALVRVHACGVCRTDLHVLDGDLPDPALPLVPGHQIVGTVEELGQSVAGLAVGQRVGIPWLGGSCGNCRYCASGSENLCDDAVLTGYKVNGGYAEYCTADALFCFPLPEEFSNVQAAPLLCAGLIGHRAHRMAGEVESIGLYGFGSAAHILTQVAVHMGRRIFAFTRPGDDHSQQFARSLGASWAGGSDEAPPEELDSAIIFAPVGSLVPAALQAVRKGGRVVCAGIHMSDIPSFPYSILWGERQVLSVANLTRRDGTEFLEIAAKVPVRTEVNTYRLDQANEALEDLRHGRFVGSAVLIVD